MNRDRDRDRDAKATAFFFKLHELAEKLGMQLYQLISKQSTRARAHALELAANQLRAQFDGTDGEQEEAPGAELETRRAPRKKTRAAVPDRDGRRGRRTPDRQVGGKPDHVDRDRDVASKVRGGKRASEAPGPAATTTKGKPRERAVMKCKKCGELGKRSDGCGKTHNVERGAKSKVVSDSDAEDESAPDQVVDEVQAPPPTARSDRFARIESAARARRAVGH